MKTLVTLVIIMMTLGVNTVAAQKYFQNPETGELIIQYVDRPLQELNIQFDANVPSSIKENEALLTKIMQNDTVELSIKPVKGVYDHFVVYYTPKTTSEIVYRNPDGQGDIRISYNPSFEQTGERQFVRWYLYWILGLIAMQILQKVENEVVDKFAGIVAIASTFIGVGLIESIFMGSFTFTFLFATIGAFTGVGVLACSFAEHNRTMNFFAIVYYVCIIIAMICAYYQI